MVSLQYLAWLCHRLSSWLKRRSNKLGKKSLNVGLDVRDASNMLFQGLARRVGQENRPNLLELVHDISRNRAAIASQCCTSASAVRRNGGDVQVDSLNLHESNADCELVRHLDRWPEER